MNTRLKWLATLMSSAVLLAACGAGAGAGPEAELVGVYAVKRDGELKELIKIERQGDRYVMRDKVRTADWSEPKMQMQPVTRAQWTKITTDTGNTAFVGVASEQLGIFKVPSGWAKNDFRTETGYFLFYSHGPVEVYRL
ncbi:hypothetical protein DBV14_21765 [Variovorax sp. KBW07]|uniref:hypothetical protein n=1 Tax=Variovorax sp. KBW07 TaxID=2153358 RepID=UPI000F58595A|nr:hypothetical protein [Variovorax sp. KBW07]RQO46649.1 hypothetical protein DBV14_21765 [Variovorax sp. KBW07]